VSHPASASGCTIKTHDMNAMENTSVLFEAIILDRNKSLVSIQLVSPASGDHNTLTV